MQTLILSLIVALAIQIGALFGLFFIFGFLLSKLQEWTQQNYYSSIGWKGILLTGWIGTPIHELSHLVFAWLFAHRIERIRLFAPNQETGELGEIRHSYNPHNLYQRAGNFFIGAAPTIGGTAALALLAFFFIPNSSELFVPLSFNSASFQNFALNTFSVFTKILTPTNFQSKTFWIFLYLSFCVSCHMAPSKPDRRQMWGGFAWIITGLVLFNIFGLIFHYDSSKLIIDTSSHLSFLTALFAYAILVSFCHYLLSLLFLSPFRRRKQG